MVPDHRQSGIIHAGAVAAVVLGLYACSRHSYLLFHSLVEVSTIAMAFTLSILTWNTRRFLTSGCLKMLGIGYGLIAVIDLLHTLAYKGMGVFPGYGANLPTQLWIAARSLQALLLVVAPLFARRNAGEAGIFAASLAAVAAVTALIYVGAFPDCFIEGSGLTRFKIISEYVISLILIVALLLFTSKRTAFSARVFSLIVISILCTIGSELAFTSYLSVYGPANMVGHFLKLAAFYLIYRALVVTGFKAPFELIFRDLQQAQEGLSREREFSHSLLESMADGVVACDAHGILTLFNRTAREWHGLDLLRLPQEEWARHYDLFRADGVTPLPTAEIPLAMAFNGEEVRDVGMAIVARGQAPRSILANGSVITDARGEKLGAVVVMRDITEFRRLEQELRRANEELECRVAARTAELRASEERLRTLFGGVPDALVIADLDTGLILDANPSAARLFGRSREALIGMHQSALHPPTLAERTRESFRQHSEEARSGKRCGPFEHVILRADGTEIPVEIVTQPVTLAGRSMVQGAFRDISERKRAEEALTLREREYHTLLDHIPDLIVRYDTELRRTYVNPAWEKASGLSAAEVVNVPAPAIPRVPQPVAAEYDQKLRRVLQAGTTETCGFLWKNAFGTELYLEYVIVPEHDRAGAISGVLAIGRDLSERRRAEEEMRRLNRELRAISTCNQTLMKAEDEPTLLNDICTIICDEAGYRLAWVGYAEHDREKTIRPVAWAGVDSDYVAQARLSWSEEQEHGRGPAGLAIRSGEPVHIRDFATDPRMAPWRESALARGYRSGIALPLKDEHAAVFGALLIYSAETYAVTAEEFTLLEDLAGDLAFGVTVLRTRTELKRTQQLVRTRLRMLETAYTTDIGLDDLLQRLLDEIEAQTESSIGFYHFLEEDQQTLSLQSWSTNTVTAMCAAEGKGRHYPVAEAGVWGDCVRERRPVIHNDYASLPHRKGLPAGHAPVVRELVVPVLRGPRIVAIIGVGNKPEAYTETDVQIATLLGDFSWEIVTRKRAEESLRRSEEGLRQRERMLNESQRVGLVGSWEWDAVHDVIWWSDEYYRIYGFASGVTPPNYEEHLQAYTPESAARLDAAVKRAMASGEPYELDLELAKPTSTTRWIVARCEVKRAANGSICGLRGTAQNITDRKRGEDTLLRLNERFALAVDAAGLGVWDWDIRKDELVWDDRMYALYGVKRKEFAGAYEAWLQGVHPADRARCDAVSAQARRGEVEYDTEFRVVWPDGSIRYLKAFGRVVRDAAGAAVRMTGINFDITERKRAEEEIRLLNEGLEQRVRERTAELSKTNEELERMNRLFVGRELRMVELKEKIRTLEGKGGQLPAATGGAGQGSE